MRIKELREAKGLKQKELAQILGIGVSTLSQYESKKREPDSAMLIKIADYFGVTVDYLLGRESNTTIAAHSDIGYGDDIPEEARKEIENFVEYIKAKYKKK